MNLEQALIQARSFAASGDWLQACEVVERALESFPLQGQLWFLLGVGRHALKERSAAIPALQKAAEFAPAAPAVFNALATMLAEEGRIAEALDVMNRAVALVPSDAATLPNHGVVLDRMGKTEAPLFAYERALDADPNLASARLNRGAALMALGRFDEAVDNNLKLVALQRGSADAHFNLSESLLGVGRSQEALAASERAIGLDASHSKAHIDRGLALADLGRFDDAKSAFDTAEAVAPGAVRAYLDRIVPADPALRRSINPRLFLLYRGHERFMRCDWSMRDLYIEELTKFVQSADAGTMERIDLPLAYQSLTVPLPQELPYRIACVIAERYAAAVAQTGVRFTYPRREGRLRLGYISADFCEHLNAYLAQPLFRMHDRKKVEVIAYSIGPDDHSEIRERVRGGADRFIDLIGLSDLDAARRINEDGVNVLVDLGGYTEHCRPAILAFLPAPVQASYLGFPGTLGTAAVHYRITDRVVTPVAQELFWQEKLVFLPDTFFVYDRLEQSPDVSLSRTEYGLPDERFVFCCFNNYYKIEPEIFAVWMEILKAVPSSVLWLAGRDPAAVGNLRRGAEVRAVSGERLVFAPFEARERYRARFRLADLFLDTPVFNAMTTACDALAAGLPLLTLAGSAFPSRVVASVLNAVRFPDGITDSWTPTGIVRCIGGRKSGRASGTEKAAACRSAEYAAFRHGRSGATARKGVPGNVAAVPSWARARVIQRRGAAGRLAQSLALGKPRSCAAFQSYEAIAQAARRIFVVFPCGLTPDPLFKLRKAGVAFVLPFYLGRQDSIRYLECRRIGLAAADYEDVAVGTRRGNCGFEGIDNLRARHLVSRFATDDDVFATRQQSANRLPGLATHHDVMAHSELAEALQVFGKMPGHLPVLANDAIRRVSNDDRDAWPGSS